MDGKHRSIDPPAPGDGPAGRSRWKILTWQGRKLTILKTFRFAVPINQRIKLTLFE